MARSQAETNTRLQNLSVKLPNWKTQYSITDAMLDQLEDDAKIYNHIFQQTSVIENDIAEFYAYKKRLFTGEYSENAGTFPTISLAPFPNLNGLPKPGIEKRLDELEAFLKKHPNRTPESLADMGVTKIEQPAVSENTLKPTIKVKSIINDRVEIVFNKQGQAACRIQMRRGNNEWTTVGDPVSSPFIDNTASANNSPEKREYRAVYLSKNEPVGLYSDIVAIVSNS